jgi:peptidoglycan/LPS O-acetylase OafA/YrhL
MEDRQLAGKSRLSFLDGLRGLAALYVMLHHMSRQIWPDARSTAAVASRQGLTGAISGGGLQKLITAPLSFGHYAVDLFIALSGFCLMLPVIQAGGKLRGGGWRFLARRARRILPPYYAALLLSLVLIRIAIFMPTGTPWDQCIAITNWGLVSHLLMLQDLCGAHFVVWSQIDHPLWSVAVEFQIYLLFPTLIWMWNRIGGIKALLASTVFILLGCILLHFSPIRILCFDYTAVFCMGVAACAVTNSNVAPWPMIRRYVPWSWIGLISLAGFVILKRFISEEDRASAIFDPAFGVVCALLLVVLSDSPRSLLRRALQWKPLAFVGTFSYSLYLIHAPLIQLIWIYLVQPIGWNSIATFFGLVFLGSLLILSAAYLFFLVCERPFLTSSSRARYSDLPAVTAL